MSQCQVSLTRREFLAGAAAASVVAMTGSARQAGAAIHRPPACRLALLHIAPGAGSLDANRALIDAGLGIAARHHAQVLITPELALSGYGFRPVIGLDWIPVMPDPWLRRLGKRAGALGVTPIIGTPERDADTGLRHNSLLVLDAGGTVIERHRKVKVIPGPLEDWASPGTGCVPVNVQGLSIGLLICADAYTPDLAREAASAGARLLLSGAAWRPGPMGPRGAWEDRSRETGLPFVVCNRTGIENGSDFTRCRSVAIADGTRMFQTRLERSCVIFIDLVGPSLVPEHRGTVRLF